MKKSHYLLALLCLLCMRQVFAQSVDTTGRIKEFSGPDVINNDITLMNTDAKSYTIKIFDEKVKAYNLKIVEPGYKAFLDFIFTKNKPTTYVASTHPFSTALTSAGNDNQYAHVGNNITKVNTFNKALIARYSGLTPAFSISDIETFYAMKQFIADYLEKSRKIQKKLNIKATEIDPTLAIEIATFNEAFSSNDTLADIKARLDNSYILEFMWIREGAISINPFDFTSSKYMKAHVQYDEEKSKLYDSYIQASIDSLMRHPSYGKLGDMKGLLKERSTGRSLYNNKKEQDSLLKINQQAIDALRTTTITVNKMPVKTDTVLFINYASKEILDSKPGIEKPVTTDDKKNVSVYNVPASINIVKLESETVITDESRFQNALGQVAKQSSDLAAIIASLSPYANLFDISKVIKPLNQVNADAHGQADLVKSAITKYSNLSDAAKKNFEKASGGDPENFAKEMKNQGLLSDIQRKILDQVLAKNPTIQIMLLQKELSDQLLQGKSIPLAIQEKNRINQEDFRSYTYYLRELDEIFKTTIPVDKNELKEREEKTPIYRTESMSTKKSADAVQKSVVLKGYDSRKKDSTIIYAFKYKIGKRYPFALSAGFIYNVTFKDEAISQTIVTKDASTGQVSITNFSQPYRFVAGVHIYPFNKGLYLQDDQLLFPKNSKYLVNRISLYAGCAISKSPLDNLYFGHGYDIVPGLKFTFGAQLYRNDKVQLLNNEIISQRLHYDIASFIGINIDPVSITNIFINLSKAKK